MTNPDRETAAAAMRRINQAWLEARIDDLAEMIYPDGFSRIRRAHTREGRIH